MTMALPILIIVASNTLYHICAKSTPEGVNTFAALAVTYIIGAAASLILYFITQKQPDLAAECRKLNWTSFALGLAIVGLEAGNILMYKVGWTLSTGQLVQSVVLAVVLIVLGRLVYHEQLSAQKLAGIAVCMLGLYLINRN